MHALLDPILVRQHSLVSRHQAWAAGLTDRQIGRLLAEELLIPVHRGVFRDPASPQTIEQRALAGVLAGGDGTVTSHRQAIALWGMRNYKCALTEISAPGFRRIPGVHSHHSRRPPDQTTLRLVPVTSPARTIIDVATQVGTALLGRWIETWLSTKALAYEDLESQMSAIKGHAGVPLVRLALSARTLLYSETDSAAEAALGLLLESSGLPALTLHHVVTLSQGLVFELDWSYPELMIAFEMDGYGVHLRSLDAFEHDRYRRNELEIAGWKILNFTRRQVERKHRTVVDQARRAVDRQAVLHAPVPDR